MILAVLLYKLVKALEYETIGADCHRDSLIVHVDNSREPLIATLTSVSSVTARKPSVKQPEAIQLSYATTPAVPKEEKQTGKEESEKDETKEETSVTRRFYAD